MNKYIFTYILFLCLFGCDSNHQTKQILEAKKIILDMHPSQIIIFDDSTIKIHKDIVWITYKIKDEESILLTGIKLNNE